MRLAPLQAMTTTPARFKRLTNWIGFLVFGVWACVTLSKMPAVGLFLAPTLLFEICVAISFLIRDEPRAATTSVRARLSAYGGSFLVMAFLQLAQRSHPEWFTPQVTAFTPLAVTFWLSGSLWTAYSVWHLRHAFSIEPAARRLITSGPYGVARHPVYTGYVVQYLGMWMTFPSAAFGAVLLIWAAAMVDRMYLEERVLSAAFPEYAEYKQRVGALCPVPFRRTPAPRRVARV
jgi:protein-S-isoprenylcysteine O-methyltransferase Ste14